jgi:geranylgeranyl reductase family protein
MRVDADVLVVGSGPAGGSSASFLVQAGYKVLVVEKEHLPRYKVCAGGVPSNALEQFPFSFSPVIEQSVQRMTFIHDQAQSTHRLPTDSLTMVMRDRFDHYILEQSKAEVLEGYTVLDVLEEGGGVTVQVQGRSKPIRARYVIGADGPNSRVARSIGLRRTRSMGAALEAEVDPDPAVQQSFQNRVVVELGKVDFGYAWVFPKSSHLSVGIGSMTKGAHSLPEHLTASMAKMGIDLQSTRMKGHPLPVYIKPEPVHKGRVLLAGDAAGLVDPLTGEGIRHAIDSGRMAAESIMNGRVGEYSRQIELVIGRDMGWAAKLANVLYSWPGPCFQWLIRNRYIFRDMIRIANGDLSYKRALMRLPWYTILALERARLER